MLLLLHVQCNCVSIQLHESKSNDRTRMTSLPGAVYLHTQCMTWEAYSIESKLCIYLRNPYQSRQDSHYSIAYDKRQNVLIYAKMGYPKWWWGPLTREQGSADVPAGLHMKAQVVSTELLPVLSSWSRGTRCFEWKPSKPFLKPWEMRSRYSVCSTTLRTTFKTARYRTCCTYVRVLLMVNEQYNVTVLGRNAISSPLCHNCLCRRRRRNDKWWV